MKQPDEREAGDRAPVMLVLPEQLVDAARVHAAESGWTRNAVVLEAMREFAPTLNKERSRCDE